jgi:ATPase family associated with various cellular activities (AAA)
MSLTVSIELISSTKGASLKGQRDHAGSMRTDREIEIDTTQVDDEGLQDIIEAAAGIKDTKTARAAESILLARKGLFDKPVPNFKAFKGVLESFLKSGAMDGWIYVTKDDGKLYPELVVGVSYDDGMGYRGNKGNPSVRIHTTSYGLSTDGNYKTHFGVSTDSHSFSPASVANRRIADILAAEGIFKETPALKEAHVNSMARHTKLVQDAFAQQFRVTGSVLRFEDDNYQRRGQELSSRRVIHDLAPKDCGPLVKQAESMIFGADSKSSGLGEIPEHPVVRVFDLRTHEFFWVNGDNMTPHVYDKTLRDKLILPETHRDLLDVLTNDLDAFVNDFIEGKSAGNVILCKGIPGVGKTLTAEVYAELIDRPLYSIHSGSLGTDAKTIEKNLSVIFQRGKRWDCVLLLDEADIFVGKRGDDLEKNAIVAEFLRTLEYFDGLLFMTTNRPEDIDDAIISRCAAIIDYFPPGAQGAGAIWMVMSEQYQAGLKPDLVASLVDLFPEIAPRDIKMLFRLALRVAKAHNEELSIGVFRRCAMFRAIKMKAAD